MLSLCGPDALSILNLYAALGYHFMLAAVQVWLYQNFGLHNYRILALYTLSKILDYPRVLHKCVHIHTSYGHAMQITIFTKILYVDTLLYCASLFHSSLSTYCNFVGSFVIIFDCPRGSCPICAEAILYSFGLLSLGSLGRMGPQ